MLAVAFDSLPSVLGERSDQLEYLTGLWAAHAAVLGLSLVSWLFLLGAVQAIGPTEGVVDHLLERLWLWLWFGLLVGGTLATGLTYVLTLGVQYLDTSKWNLGFLPLFDSGLFVLSLLVSVWLATHAARFLHGRVISALTLEVTEKAAFALRRAEAKEQKAERTTRRRSFRRLLSSPQPQRKRLRWRPPSLPSPASLWRRRVVSVNKRTLQRILPELEERAVSALRTDDVEAVRFGRAVLLRAIGGTASAEHSDIPDEYSSYREGDGDLSLLDPWTISSVRLHLVDLMEQALKAAQAPRCSHEVLWAPVQIWRTGVEQRAKLVSEAGLRLLVQAYTSSQEHETPGASEILFDFWSEQPYGPENFVRHTARTTVRREGVSSEDELYVVFASIEFQEAALTLAGISSWLEDYSMAGNMTASLANMARVFHYVDSDRSSPELLRKAVEEYDETRLQGFVFLVGILAVHAANGKKDGINILRYAVRNLCEMWSFSKIEAMCSTDDNDEPRWYWEVRSLAGIPSFDFGERNDFAYPSDLKGLALLLARSELARVRRRPVPGAWKPSPNELVALRRIAVMPSRWRGLLSRGIISRASQPGES